MEEKNIVIIYKIIFGFLIFLVSFISGILPYMIKSCRTNSRLISFANAFSGGLFLGIGVIHILPEAVEKFENISVLPIPYIIVVGTYFVLLFIEKIIFGHIEHNHSHSHKDKENEEHEEEEKLEQIKDEINQNYEEKEKLVNFSSSEDTEPIILFNENEEKNSQKEKNKPLINKETKEKRVTAFALLIALSIHEIFENLAFGIQSSFKDVLFLFIAIIIHNWAETFALGIFFIKGGIAKTPFFILITIFCLISPVGIAIGIFLSILSSELIEGIFLAISVGTFIYASCSEILIEEFEESEGKCVKFAFSLLGSSVPAYLSILEQIL